MDTELVTGPATFPVTAAELRRHVWTVHERESGDDTYFEELIESATDQVERDTGRKLVSQVWRGYLDSWPAARVGIELPFGKVTAVTRFNWLGSDAVDHTLVENTHFACSLTGYWPKVVPCDSWPSGSLFVVDPIRIEFRAGFGEAKDVPPALRHAIKMLAAHWYQNREIVRVGNIVSPLPMAYKNLISEMRIRGV